MIKIINKENFFRLNIIIKECKKILMKEKWI